jgi:hypothetical protein
MVIVKGRDYHSVKYLHTVVVDQDDGEKITARVCNSLRIKQFEKWASGMASIAGMT